MPDDLEPRVKVAINTYLFRWLAVIGIANALAVLAGFAYIFFVLPKKATTEAVVLVQNEVQSLRDQLISATGKALTEAGRAQGIAQTTTVNASAAQLQIEKLRGSISSVEEENVAQVGRVIQALKSDPRLDAALNLSPRVIAMEKTLQETTYRRAVTSLVSWTDLVKLTDVSDCDRPDVVASGACLVAAHRYCSRDQGAVSGFMTEHSPTTVQATCVW